MAGILDAALAYNPQILELLNGANMYPQDATAAKAMAAQFRPEDVVGPEMRAELAKRSADADKDYSRGKWLALARAGFTMADKGIGAGANAGLNDLAGVINDRKASKDADLNRRMQLAMLEQGRANTLAQAAQGFYGKGLDAASAAKTNALNTSIGLADKDIDNKRQNMLAGLQAKQVTFATRSPEEIYQAYREIMPADEALKMVTGSTDSIMQSKMKLLSSLANLTKDGAVLPEGQQVLLEQLTKEVASYMQSGGVNGAGGAPGQGIAALVKPGPNSIASPNAAPMSPQQQPNEIADRMIAAAGNPKSALARLNATPDSVLPPAEKKLLKKAIEDRTKFYDDVAKASGYR